MPVLRGAGLKAAADRQDAGVTWSRAEGGGCAAPVPGTQLSLGVARS